MKSAVSRKIDKALPAEMRTNQCQRRNRNDQPQDIPCNARTRTRFLKFLRGIEDSTANISATTIAKELELGEVQVRKDLRALCGSGKPKTGYKVGELTASLASCLSEKDGGTVIIGAGKLGRALLDYAGFADYGLNILAAFDIAVAEPVSSPKVNIFILFQSLILSAANTMQGSALLQFRPKQHSRLATNYTMPE